LCHHAVLNCPAQLPTKDAFMQKKKPRPVSREASPMTLDSPTSEVEEEEAAEEEELQVGEGMLREDALRAIPMLMHAHEWAQVKDVPRRPPSPEVAAHDPTCSISLGESEVVGEAGDVEETLQAVRLEIMRGFAESRRSSVC